MADAYRKQGNLEDAFDVCKKGLEKHPTYTSAHVVLGRIYQEQSKVEDAAAEFKKVLELDPENLMAHSLLGSIYMAKNDYQTAIEEYQKILTLNPDDEETQISLKQAIVKASGEQKVLKENPKEILVEKKAGVKESTASLTIAELYLKQGHIDKAVEVYQELLANDPQNLMLRQKLSDVVDRRQKESAVDTTVSKLKKNDFIQPPDQKEDVITEEAKTDPKKQNKSKKEDDSKFTSEDILQVMRRGGKDDAVVEEKASSQPLKKSEPAIVIPVMSEKKSPNTTIPVDTPGRIEKQETAFQLESGQIDGLKGILAELSSVEGIMRCFLTGNDGKTIVSMGETSNNAELGKQALTIFDNTHRSVKQLNQGKVQQVLVTAETGHILLVSFSNFVLIVLANSKINLGLLRLSLDSATKKVEKIL